MTIDLQTIITNEGFQETQDARLNGRYINISNYGVSEILGTYSNTRNINTINGLWVEQPINSAYTISVNPNTQQIRVTIPPQVLNLAGNPNLTNKNVTELYIFAETQEEKFTVNIPGQYITIPAYLYNKLNTGDSLRFHETSNRFDDTGTLPDQLLENKTFFCIKTATANQIKIAVSYQNALDEINLTGMTAGNGAFTIAKYFLYLLAQFVPEPMIWVSTSSLELRPQFVINNLPVNQVIQYLYTQAQEISDHNLDPNAHPAIQKALNYGGIFVQDIQFEYRGQNFYKLPVFDSSVTDNMLVYLKSGTGTFFPALGTTGEVTKIVGIAKIYADTSKNAVRTGGLIYTGHAFPINTELYLSDVTPGLITNSFSPFRVGKSLGNGIVQLEAFGGGSGGANYIGDLLDVTTSSEADRQVLLWDQSGVGHWTNDYLNLQDLGNVVIAGSPSGNLLRHNGTNWINSQYGINVTANMVTEQFIENLNFGTGFTLSGAGGGSVTVNFTGLGSFDIIDLGDVETPYPTDTNGILLFNNLNSNASPKKVEFFDVKNTSSTDPKYSVEDDGIFGRIFHNTMFEYPCDEDFDTISESGVDYFYSTKIFEDGIQSSNRSTVYKHPRIGVGGNGITGLQVNSKSWAKFINFNTGFTGVYDPINDWLTVNVTGGSGNISQVNNTDSGFFPLVKDNGDPSGTAVIRGFRNKTGRTEIIMRDNSGVITNNINFATHFELDYFQSIIALNTTATGTRTTGVFPTIKRINSDKDIGARGIKGEGGITVQLEVSGSNENIVISGSGGGGLALGGTYNVSGGTGLTLNIDSGVETGFKSSGIGTGICFEGNNGEYSFQANQSKYGFYASNTCTNPIKLGSKTVNGSTFEAGTIAYGNIGGGGEGFYIKTSSACLKIATAFSVP